MSVIKFHSARYCANIVSCRQAYFQLYCACYCAYPSINIRNLLCLYFVQKKDLFRLYCACYCASIVSSKRNYAYLYCACYCPRSSIKIQHLLCLYGDPWFEFIVPVIVPALASKFKFYCASSSIKIQNLLCLYYV